MNDYRLLSGFLLLLALPPAFAVETSADLWEVILCNPLLAQLERESTWEAAHAVGVTAIEVSVDTDLKCSRLLEGDQAPYRLDTPENARRLSQAAEAHGLKTPVLCAPLSIRSDLPPGAPEWAKTLIQNAPHAGAELIYFPLVGENFTQTSLQDDLFIERAVSIMQELVPLGRQHRIKITMENLSVYLNRPEVTEKILAAFQPDELNLCLDPINFYWYGHPRSEIYGFVQRFAPRAAHFHAKNVDHPEEQEETRRTPGWNYGEHSVAVPQGDLDFGKLLAELKRAGYQGYVSIEDDSLGHHPVDERVQVLRQDVEYLRETIRGLSQPENSAEHAG